MSETLSEAAATMLRHARVARLATLLADGTPHVVPVCPALDGDRIVVASEDTVKVRNIRGDPRVALVVDDYVEDWGGLRRVLVWGTARVVEEATGWERARGLLYEKFQQYEPQAEIVSGKTSIVEIRIDRVSTEGL